MWPHALSRRGALLSGAVLTLASSTFAQDIAEASARIEVDAMSVEQQRERFLEFRPWKKNFFLASRDLGDPQDDVEAKFQVSIRSRLADWGPTTREWSVDFAYTGLNLWRAFTSNPDEAYFTADHAPEIFLETPVVDQHWLFRFSPFLHQSNGEDGADSRSWNRAYLEAVWHSHIDEETPSFFFDPEVGGGWRLGMRFSAAYGIEEENADIEDYLGNLELNADFYRNDWGRSVLTLSYRDSSLVADDPHHSFQVDFGIDVSEDVRLSFQYLTGYGDTLLRYNEQVQRVGIGIEIAP